MVSLHSFTAHNIGLTSSPSIHTKTEIVYPKPLKCLEAPFWQVCTRLVLGRWIEVQSIAMSPQERRRGHGLPVGL